MNTTTFNTLRTAAAKGNIKSDPYGSKMDVDVLASLLWLYANKSEVWTNTFIIGDTVWSGILVKGDLYIRMGAAFWVKRVGSDTNAVCEPDTQVALEQRWQFAINGAQDWLHVQVADWNAVATAYEAL